MNHQKSETQNMITVFIINLVKIFRKKEFRQGSQGETLGKVSGGNED